MVSFWIWVCAALAGSLLLIDVACKLTGHDTLSSTIRVYSKQYPLIPFFMGMLVAGLAAHFWYH